MKSKILKSQDQLFGTELVFEDFRIYQNIMENYLIKAKINFEEIHNERSLIKEAKKAGEFEYEYSSYLFDQYIEENINISILYPHNFRASFLIQIIAFIEFELLTICKYHQSLHKIDFQVKDDFGNAKKYLTKYCEIKIDMFYPEWRIITTLRKIRHKLVHHQGIIATNDKDWSELESFIRDTDSIELIETQKDNNFDKSKYYKILIKKKSLNEKLIKESQNFFIKLLKEIIK